MTTEIVLTEKQFMQQVIDLLKLRNWFYYHTHDSRRSVPGFPDIIALKGARMLVIELKSEKGQLTWAQKRWFAAFLVACPKAKVRIWRPSDWDEILEATS